MGSPRLSAAAAGKACQGARVSSRSLVAKHDPPTVWHNAVIRCVASSSSSSAPSHQRVQAPASRVREVETACDELVESIEAGDGPWCERVVTQLREVLVEQHAASTGTRH